MARLATDHWFAPSWWPYWDGGIPFEFAYAPLVPAATVLWSKLAGVEVPRAFHSVSAVIYILAPLTLFLAARALSGRTLDSFAAALLYSLTAVTELIDPDQSFTWSNLGNARRLYLQFIWDETPHLAALAFLPLAVLFLARSFETARPLYYLLTIFSMVLVVLSNAFGATMILIAMVCLLLAHPARNLLRHLAITAGTGMVSYAIVCPWLPPQLLQAISHAGKVNDERVWSAGSLTVLGLLVIGLTAIHRYLAAR
ncbi:MAG TPA: hypothetical protein VEQ63_16575, partial [Bryobacteraceae bacterium]|nr:hypothetical protein [Bryobacteraceae bacterium]